MKLLNIVFVLLVLNFSSQIQSQCLFFRIDSSGAENVLYGLFEYKNEVVTIHGTVTVQDGQKVLNMIPYFQDLCIGKFKDSLLFYNGWSFRPASVFSANRILRLDVSRILIPSRGDTTYLLKGPIKKSLILNLETRSFSFIYNPVDSSEDLVPLVVTDDGHLWCYSSYTEFDSTIFFKFDLDLNLKSRFSIPYNYRLINTELISACKEGFLLISERNFNTPIELWDMNKAKKLYNLPFTMESEYSYVSINSDSAFIYGGMVTSDIKRRGLLAWLDKNTGAILDSVSFHFGAIQDVIIKSLIKVPDGWIIGGSYKKTNRSDALTEVFIAKINSDKSIDWVKVFNATANAPRSTTNWTGMTALADGTFIAWGYIFSVSYKTWLMKFNENGDIISSNSDLSFSSSEVELFPNPASNRINLIYPDEFCVKNIQVIDLDGKHRIQMQVSGCTRLQGIDVSSLPSGIYRLEMNDQNGKLLQKSFVIAE